MRYRHVRRLLVLLALGSGARMITAWLVQQPGYTDACYYAVGAHQLYDGNGFNEPFIWNWLDAPSSVPHPGYLYWMPLTAIVGWIGMTIGGNSFRAMQAPFVLLSALLPLVAYGIAWDLTGKRRHALLAGLLALFPGFYAHVFVLPDSFAPFALFGSLCLWTAGRGLRDGRPAWFGLAGLTAGLGHLTRADGALLVGIAFLSAVIVSATTRADPSSGTNRIKTGARIRWRNLAWSITVMAVGYLVVMGPWLYRNWRVMGTPLPAAGTQTLFLTNYDDMFGYDQELTLHSYLAWGWRSILMSKWQALLLNLQRLWVEGLLVFLLPLTAVGLWKLRRQRVLWPFFVYLSLLFVTMTFLFSFPGTRGGLYHSGAALLPFFFATSGPGLETVLQAAARRLRGWRIEPAWQVFGSGLVLMAMLVSAFASWRAGVFSGAWNQRDESYVEIGQWLDARGEDQAVVMVGDAPSFTWRTGHLAIAVPSDSLDTVVSVAERYGAQYLVLDDSRPRTTDMLFYGEETYPHLIQRSATASWQVYEVAPTGS